VSNSRITISNQTTGVQPDPDTGLHEISISAGTTSLKHTISASLRIEHRTNASISVHYGKLPYGLDIGSTNSSQPPLDFRSTKPLPEGYAPSQIRDWAITNTTSWAIAIDPSTLSCYHSGDAELQNPIWAPGTPPSWISATACEITWSLFLNSVPDRVPLPEQRKCSGDVIDVKLVPYGSAKLHMSELPTIDLSTVWNVDIRNQPLQYGIF
jgi:hypothetical protein